jgi:hypothetical protein
MELVVIVLLLTCALLFRSLRRAERQVLEHQQAMIQTIIAVTANRLGVSVPQLLEGDQETFLREYNKTAQVVVAMLAGGVPLNQVA